MTTINYHFISDKVQPNIFYTDTDILILDNVLSNNECDFIKDIIDIKTDINILRNKISVNFQDLSNIINLRCNKFIPKIVYEYDKKSYDHDDNHLYWSYNEISTNWHLTKCNINSKLTMHFDAVYVKSVDNKSIYTIMLYLEDSDGDLKFDNLQVSPKKGRLVIFNHKLLHEGLENKHNIKYFIRSKIMFIRNRPIETFNDMKALELYNKSKEKNDKVLEDEAFKLSPLLEKIILQL